MVYINPGRSRIYFLLERGTIISGVKLDIIVVAMNKVQEVFKIIKCKKVVVLKILPLSTSTY